MKNKIFEEKLKDISADYMYNKAIESFLLILMSFIEDIKKYNSKILYENNTEIVSIKNDIKYYVINMKNILNDNKQNPLKNCMKIKNRIIELYRKIYIYIYCWNVYSLPIYDEIKIRKHKNKINSDILINVFYNDCRKFIDDIKDINKKNSIISEILKYIPLKISRNNYFDILKSTLKNIFKSETQYIVINTIKALEYTHIFENNSIYGKYFNDIACKLSQKKNINAKNLSDNELEKEYLEMNNILEEINNILEYISKIFNDINSLIILFYTQYNFEQLTNNNIEYIDSYNYICEILKNKIDTEYAHIFCDSLNNKLENLFEPIIDKSNKLSDEELKITKQIKSFENLSDETIKNIMSNNFIRNLYYSDINDEIFNIDYISNNKSKIASDEFVNTEIDNFIINIKTSIYNLPSNIRKYIMQSLLSSLPNNFTTDETINIIKNSIENSSPENKILIINKIGALFVENGYNFLNEKYDINYNKIFDHNCNHNCNCNH